MQVAVAGLKGRVAVLKQNAYSMQQGGISVAHKAKPKENPLAKKRQVGGEGVEGSGEGEAWGS